MYNKDGKIYLGLSEEGKVELPLSMANRHGLIAGASGTGKTITMKVMAESFADAKVLMELGVGHALVSVLDEKGVPGMVRNTPVICPQSLMAPCDEGSYQAALRADSSRSSGSSSARAPRS